MEGSANSQPQGAHVEAKTDKFQPKETLVILDSLAAKAVDHYRKEGKISAEELKALQEKKLQSLAPERKVRVEGVRERLVDLGNKFRGLTDGLRLQAMRFVGRAGAADKYDDEQRSEYHNEAAELQQKTKEIDDVYAETRDIALKEAWQDAKGGETAEIDPSTGLHTEPALMQRLSRRAVDAVSSKDPQKLINIEVRAGDMNNFKQGNDILGHTGFDDLLQGEFAEKFIAISSYLGSSEYAQEVDEEEFDKMFPPGSVLREKLDRAKGKIKLDLYRMKAGADEIYTVTEYEDGVSEDERNNLRDLSQEIVDETFQTIVIGKHKTEELGFMHDIYNNSPNYFKQKLSFDADTGMVLMNSEEADFWNKFGDGLRLYISTTEWGEKIRSDSETKLRLSADMSKPHNLAEGIKMLTHGVRLGGETDTSQRQGAVVDGKLDIAQFTDNVYKSVNRRVEAVGLSSEEEMEELVKLGVANSAVGILLHESMRESEEISKPQGKKDLLVNAWTGDGDTPSEDAYNVGSLISVGRLVQDISKPDAAREVYQRTLDSYKVKMQTEISKMSVVLAESGWTPGQDVVKPLVDAFRQGKINYDLLRFYDKIATTVSKTREQIKRQANIGSNEEVEPEYPSYLAEMPALPDGILVDDFQQAILNGTNPRFVS